MDLLQHVTGRTLTSVAGVRSTFVTERPLPTASAGLAAVAGTDRGPVTVDDATAFLGRLDGGALAVVEATRFAPGRKNALRLEVNGSLGSLSFDVEALNELWYHDGSLPAAEGGFRRILATEADHPYLEAWWPPGHGLGYDAAFVHQVRDLVLAMAEGSQPSPSFADGLQVQRVLDAVERSATDESWWTAVPVGADVPGPA